MCVYDNSNETCKLEKSSGGCGTREYLNILLFGAPVHVCYSGQTSMSTPSIQSIPRTYVVCIKKHNSYPNPYDTLPRLSTTKSNPIGTRPMSHHTHPHSRHR